MPTASVGSSQAPTAAVDKSLSASNTKIQTAPGQVSAANALDYFRFYRAADPRLQLLYSLEDGEWFHCHERFDDAYVAGSQFYQEFLIPYGGRYTAGTKLIDSESEIFVLTLVRGCTQSPLHANDWPQLTKLRHHLAEALRNLVHVGETLRALSVAREVLGQFRFAMILMRPDRSILHVNRSGQMLLADSDALSDQNGFLTIWNRQDCESVDTAIADLLTHDASRPTKSRRRAVRLNMPNGKTLIAFLSILHPTSSMEAYGYEASVLLIIHDPEDQSLNKVDAQLLAEGFDLTPAEANVSAQLASGLMAKQIAKNSNIALSTVRSHIQKVMAKTGTKRQSELVRTLAQIPLGSR